MFGWFKRKAQEHQQARADIIGYCSDEAAGFAINLKSALGGFPRTMLDDPFIVGALAMYAAITAKVTTNGQATNVMLEAAMVQAIEKSFAGQGVAHHEAKGALLQFKSHPEYAKGVQVVSLILAAKYERKEMVSDPILADAKARVVSMPKAFRNAFGETESEQVAYEVTKSQFIEPMKAKYGELWRH